jgi:transketolase
MADPLLERLQALARRVRHDILVSTTEAGSGHPTSSLSATDLMVGLMFGGTFRFDPDRPHLPNNDRLVFSKGHASPLLYSLWAAAGRVSPEELLTLRKFGSRLEGHPTPAFPYAEAATGSLGQGLSIGVGLALNAKLLDKLPYRTYVLLGDSEMSEGSQWEAIQIAAHYGLDNLVGIIDVNRLGQRGETMYGHDTEAYARRVAAFGWEAIVIDGHDMGAILDAYRRAQGVQGRPTMIVARTIKGKGVSFVEDKNGWHGKALSREELRRALDEIGPVDPALVGAIAPPEDIPPVRRAAAAIKEPDYPRDKPLATRKAYGRALARIYGRFPDIVVLDGEVKNSTYAQTFETAHPDRFFEMYIAEQNMADCAAGLAARDKIPFVSTFSAFWSRAFDQIRMDAYSRSNIKFVGSHAGVSIGQDGPSQMGLEDLAMFRTLLDSVILYPCDAYSTERLVEQAAQHRGIVYLRTTRSDTPIVYGPEDEFPIGGCKVLRRSDHDRATVVAAGITVFEALAAYEALKKTGVLIRVIDLYSVKPMDWATLADAARETKALLTVEDHYAAGGIGEAVQAVLSGLSAVSTLAVRQMPRSGTPAELLDFEGISRTAIINKIKEVL